MSYHSNASALLNTISLFDRALGYFINYYNVSRHSSTLFFAEVPHDRMEDWLESGIYKKPTGMCLNVGVEHCTQDSLVCHDIPADDMVVLHRKNENRRGAQKNPPQA
jgi:hypothetical protein